MAGVSTLEVRQRVRGLYAPDVKNVDNLIVKDSIERYLSKVVSILDQQEKECNVINSDLTLSDEGKQRQLEKSRWEAAKDIKAQAFNSSYFQKQLEGLTSHIPDASGKDDVLEFIKLQEVRERLRELPREIVVQMYLTGVDDGENDIVVSALEADPMPYDFVTSERIEATKQQRIMKKMAPEDAEKYHSLAIAERVSRCVENEAINSLKN
jgi:hypothetical protein